MNLLLVRHGESLGNKQGVIQGLKDFPLTTVGEKQAVLLGNYMANESIDVLYTSDLTRAAQTAEQIAKHHPIEATKWGKVREIGLGPLEGKTRAEIFLQYPEVKDNSSILTTNLPGTELVCEITDRCQYVLEQLLAAHRGNNVVVVSHGGFISIFLMYLMFAEKWNDVHRPFIVGNTGVSRIQFLEGDKPVFHYVNRDGHLLIDNQAASATVIY